MLGRALAEGFAFQGDASGFRDGERRGTPSQHLPPLAFVNSLQTHDQVGNRAFGERIATLAEAAGRADALRALTACVLLAPAPPMLFMGEEFAASAPFLYFCDFDGELAARRHGRAPQRVRPLRALRRRAGAQPHPRPERAVHLRAQQARLGRARERAACAVAGAVQRLAACAPRCVDAVAGRCRQRAVHAVGRGHAAHRLAAGRRSALAFVGPAGRSCGQCARACQPRRPASMPAAPATLRRCPPGRCRCGCNPHERRRLRHAPAAAGAPATAIVPRATYRLQLHRDFRFADAMALRALPGRARHQPPVHLAAAERASRQPARLRRGRPRHAESRTRHAAPISMRWWTRCSSAAWA